MQYILIRTEPFDRFYPFRYGTKMSHFDCWNPGHRICKTKGIFHAYKYDKIDLLFKLAYAILKYFIKGFLIAINITLLCAAERAKMTTLEKSM